jgi:hypothetical protein
VGDEARQRLGPQYGVGRFDETRIFYEIYVLFIPSIMAGVKKALEVEEMAQTEAQLIEIGT